MLNLLSKNSFIKAGVALGFSYLVFKVASNFHKVPTQHIPIIPIDISSFSNLAEVTTESYHLDLFIDFSNKKLTGSILLKMRSLINGLSIVHLDIKLLKIKSVFYKDQKIQFLEQKVSHGQALGDKLTILLPEKLQNKTDFTLNIEYETKDNGEEISALNWLEPSQTLGKKLPYFYTQSEPIYSRTIAPMQDSPSVKSSYSARIKVLKDFNAFMSAQKTAQFSDETYSYHEFKQEVPIPSYLLALIAGNIKQRTLTNRTGVITEPEDLDRCAKELEDLEKFIQTIENYLFEYGWGPYNVVVLPPSFPYGGMENPMLTFVNPSIITGDKSNIDVAIHEIAHSWSGNLVTCKNWSSFWLNEGITMFLERKAVRELFGEKKYQLGILLENIGLNESILSYGPGHNFTSLSPDFSDFQNPDDAFSKIPYEKGFQLMLFLEKIIGEETMRAFLRVFMRKFSFKSCNSDDFVSTFQSFLKEKFGKKSEEFLQKIKWDDWLKKPGFPPEKLDVNVNDFEECKLLAEKFINENDNEITIIESYHKFDLNLKIVFLKTLYEKNEEISKEKMQFLLDRLQLNEEKNKEITVVWCRLIIKNKFFENLEFVEDFLGSTGRMKFVNPLYIDLNKVDQKLAREIYEKKKPLYHSITRGIIQKKLELN